MRATAEETRGGGTNTDGDKTVHLGPGAGGEPFHRLPLQHHHEPLDVGSVAQQVEQQRGAHVVGEIGDHHPTTLPGDRIHPRRIGEPHLGRIADHFLEQRPEPLIDLVGNHPSTGGGEAAGQRAGTGADLEHLIAGTHGGHFDDPPHDVGVDQEVLSQRFARSEPVSGEQTDGGGPSQRIVSHGETPWQPSPR
jgi:hypothetical protein